MKKDWEVPDSLMVTLQPHVSPKL